MLPGIGIFGTGPVVHILVPILREKGFEIAAIWNSCPQDAADTAKTLNIPYSTSKIDEILLRKGVDLVFVMCAPNLHAQISMKALGIGKHVVCDRPGGLDQSDAFKMVGAGAYYPSLISIINHPLRFMTTFQRMRATLQNSEHIGELLLIDVRIDTSRFFENQSQFDWRFDAEMGGGTLSLIGSHIIDLVTFLTGKRASKVHGLVRTFQSTTEKIQGIRRISAPDFCTFQMEFGCQLLVTVSINSHIQVPEGFRQEVTIRGTLGHLSVRGGNLYHYQNDGTEKLIYREEETQSPQNEANPLHFVTSSLPQMFIKGICEMVNALRESFMTNSGEFAWAKECVGTAATFDDGLYVQAVLAAIRESSKTKKWIRVEMMTKQADVNSLLSAAVRRTTISIK